MFDVVYIHDDDDEGKRKPRGKKEKTFACKDICVFYKNRIRVTKIQTTKEDDVSYLAHQMKERR